MFSSSLSSSALALSLLSFTGCAVEGSDEEAELSSEEQALDTDEIEEGPTGTTTTTIYPMMSIDLLGIDADSRTEDGNGALHDPVDDDQFCQGSVTGVVGKNSTGKYILKTSATGSQITSASGKAAYSVAVGMIFGQVPLYETHYHDCTIYLQ